MSFSIDERRAAGRDLRNNVPLAAHGEQAVTGTWRDPIAFLEAQAQSRAGELLPSGIGAWPTRRSASTGERRR